MCGATRVPEIMALNTVKCGSCNVVISELLAFVQNKADVMDEDSIIRLCNTAFKTDAIVAAKKLLFESVQTSGRNINRKGDGKDKRDMEDILRVIKETDPDCLPIFVARDLQLLPPVTFDHLDATRLLKDIIKLQHDITVIKENYVTKEMLEVPSPEVKDFVNNKRRGAGLMVSFDCESGPIGLPHISPDKGFEITDLTNNKSGVLQNTNTSAVLCKQTQKICCNDAVNESLSVPQAPGETGLSVASTVVSARVPNKKSYAEAAVVIEEVNHRKRQRKDMQDDNNEWTTVRRKRNKNKFVGKKGTAIISTESKFKAANRSIPFYIYNVSKDCPSTVITEYIKCKTGVDVNLEKTSMKLEKEYEAYKFLIPKDTLSMFMDENMWPSGISFRKYVPFYKKWTNSDNKQSSASVSEK